MRKILSLGFVLVTNIIAVNSVFAGTFKLCNQGDEIIDFSLGLYPNICDGQRLDGSCFPGEHIFMLGMVQSYA